MKELINIISIFCSEKSKYIGVDFSDTNNLIRQISESL